MQKKKPKTLFVYMNLFFFRSNPSPLPDVFKTDDDKKDAVQVAS